MRGLRSIASRKGAGMPATLAAVLILVSSLAAGDEVYLRLGMGRAQLIAEIAATPAARALGLMFRQTLAPAQGMLFVYPKVQPICMWMRNTRVPLAVAFLDGQGRILNIERMQPGTDANHCSRQPAVYALETNQDWFARNGIVPGMRVRGLEHAPAPR